MSELYFFNVFCTTCKKEFSRKNVVELLQNKNLEEFIENHSEHALDLANDSILCDYLNKTKTNCPNCQKVHWDSKNEVTEDLNEIMLKEKLKETRRKIKMEENITKIALYGFIAATISVGAYYLWKWKYENNK